MSEREICQTKDGRTYFVQGDLGVVRAFDNNDTIIAELLFIVHEGDGKMPDSVSFYSADTNENWQRQGVATACFEYARRHFYDGLSISAPSRTDSAKIDGNYVTADGYALNESLRRKGWVTPDPADQPEE